MVHPPFKSRTYSTGRVRALGTVLWFMRGIPPRSMLSYVNCYIAMTRR